MHFLPDGSQELRAGDQILFCGTWNARRILNTTLRNSYLKGYRITGIEEPRGYFMRWLARKARSEPEAST